MPTKIQASYLLKVMKTGKTCFLYFCELLLEQSSPLKKILRSREVQIQTKSWSYLDIQVHNELKRPQSCKQNLLAQVFLKTNNNISADVIYETCQFMQNGTYRSRRFDM